MRKIVLFWLALFVSAAALAASAVLLVDYVRPAPVFCAVEGGCGLVKRTIFAYPMGVPMPAFGIVGFLAIGLLVLVPGKRARIAQAILASFAALVAVGLLVVQAMMGTLCPYCAVADGSALVLLGLSLARAIGQFDPPEGKLRIGAGAGTVLAAVAAPLALGFSMKPPPVDLPDVIAAEIAKTPEGKVTVVDFVDFECPFCRRTHAELAPVLAAHAGEVRLARKHVPLRMHPHALDAARAGHCGEVLGRGDEMADALFRASPDRLTKDGTVALATALGLDEAKFRACLDDPSTDARIKADGETFRAAKGHGLPTIWFDGVKLEGEQSGVELGAALREAHRAK